MSEATTNKKQPRLKKYYDDEVVPFLLKEFSLKNPMQVPRLEKITLNMGLGEAIQNPKALEAAAGDLAQIAGQKPVTTRAKKSIATFKLREGMPIGCMVTLRRERMWEFLDRLANLALPRVRDFRGISGKLDGRGNYSLGIKEQIIFHEINYDKVDKLRGMNITFVTTAPNDEQGKALLKQLGLPFKS
jgi:large subunit ribosomal protein L5